MAGILYNAVCAKCEAHTGYSHSPLDEDKFICSVCARGGAPITRKKAEQRLENLSPSKPRPLVTSFAPAGRTGLYIYAVVVKQHPDKVKIGMTRKWVNRRRSYANWDLSPGDAIVEERVFCISEEFVDLEKLEAHILQTFGHPRAFGAEWFRASLDDAARHIDRIMCANDISYSM